MSMGAGPRRERRIRRRATALVARDGRLLLLREPDDDLFDLPGGGVQDGEPPSAAAARELREETGLAARRMDYLFDYCEFFGEQGIDHWGQVHSVFRVDATGEVTLSDEHCELAWWDGATATPLHTYVWPILSLAEGSG